MRQLFLFTSLGFIIGLVSINETESDTYNTTKNLKSKGYTEEEIKYFNEITLKNELNSKIRLTPAKFKRDIKIYVYGDYEPYMLDEVKRVVDDLNDIINPIDLSIVNNRCDANVVMYFGDYESFTLDNPDLKRNNKLKNCKGFFTTKSKGSNEIVSSRIFINVPKHHNIKSLFDTLREELTQQIGFFNDCWLYPESCFYQGGNEVLKYSEIDVKLIKMLYND
jgi:hypothetical protein